jgi:hypothetical protein
MKVLSIGEARYQIVAVEREGQWVAHAEREETGKPFGIECTGDTEADAVERLSRWLEWQNAHQAALESLQAAERAYHRTIAGSAFASPTEGPSAAELQKESLDVLEEARVRLDDVRARKPE